MPCLWLQNHDEQLSLDEWEELIKSCDRQKWIADGHSEDDFEWDRPHKVVKKMFKVALHETRLPTDVRERRQNETRSTSARPAHVLFSHTTMESSKLFCSRCSPHVGLLHPNFIRVLTETVYVGRARFRFHLSSL